MSLQTPAGPTNNTQPLSRDAQKQAINEAFALFRANYQHLYFSAYPDKDSVNLNKRLWLESLGDFSSEIILEATHAIIKQSDYLPTISRMIKKCSEIQHHLPVPDVHSAYTEACNAPSPKQNYSWSHPAVYYAGQKSNWYFLASNSEKLAFPIFKSHYEKLLEQIAQGQRLPPIATLSLPENIETPLSKEENAERLSALRAAVDL